MVIPPSQSIDNHYLSVRLVIGSGHVEILNRINKPILGCIAESDKKAMKLLALCLDDVVAFRVEQAKQKHANSVE